jgi:hypothetical protein
MTTATEADFHADMEDRRQGRVVAKAPCLGEEPFRQPPTGFIQGTLVVARTWVEAGVSAGEIVQEDGHLSSVPVSGSSRLWWSRRSGHGWYRKLLFIVW